MQANNIRNVAIIAHVDHGKTTLLDELLKQSGTLNDRKQYNKRLMDSDALEQERGITILAKNTAIQWQGKRINIIDTPGHADFGGEVERILRVVDSVLLLVDATEGPMPQTRFVTQKSLELGLKPIVVVNKIDRDSARADWALDKTFDLFDELDATDEQLDFSVIYASAINGYSGTESTVRSGDMKPLFNMIIDKVPAPQVNQDGELQMQIIALAYDTYKGVIGTGRVQRGSLKLPTQVVVVDAEGKTRRERLSEAFIYNGLKRVNISETCAGDIIAVCGPEKLHISDTICDPSNVEPLATIAVEQPTVRMTFQVNDSPFVGKSGSLLTSRQLRERLTTECLHNVALRVEESGSNDAFEVSGRGELHLSILLENMRREGFEIGVSKPEVIYKEVAGVKQEPYEQVTVDVPNDLQGTVVQAFGERRAIMQDMHSDTQRSIIEFLAPARSLIGFRSKFLSLTQGKGLLHHAFVRYDTAIAQTIGKRKNGVLISATQGKASGYALFNLQERGSLLIGPGEEVYEGMVIGIHSRENDLVVNPLKSKQLTNIRAAGSDENILLIPPIRFSLEQALDFINDDDLVEIVPDAIRIRKRYLKERERKRQRNAGM